MFGHPDARAAVRRDLGGGRVALQVTLCVGAALAVLVAVALAAVAGPALTAGLGLPDPGPVTRYALSAVRVVADAAAALTIGALLLAAVLVPPRLSGYLDIGGYLALRAAASAAGVWAVAALLLVLLTAAEAIGRPVQDVLDLATLRTVVTLLPTSAAWAATAGLAIVVMVGGRIALTWGGAVILLALSLITLLPVAATGHSAVGGSHDIASDSLLLHVVGASVWVGGLVAVLSLALSPAADQISVALPRFSVIASWCWALMAVSGLVNLLVRVPVAELLLTSTYGLVAGGKVIALLVLGFFGLAHRRRSLVAAAAGDRSALLQLGGVELLVMFATLGLAVGLSRTPPPRGSAEPASRTAEVLGYRLDEAPTLTGLLLDARLDLVFVLLAAILLAGYLLGVWRLRTRAPGWPLLRTAAWITGCGVIVIATSSGMGKYGAALLSVEVAAQVTLSVLAPALLVAGAPFKLARLALPTRHPYGGPSPRGSLLWVLRQPLLRRLSRPGPAIGLFIGGQIVLYGSGLLGNLLGSQMGRATVDAFLLATGCLVAGALRYRRTWPSCRTRWVLAAILLGGQVAIGASLLLRGEPMAEQYYRGLALPWAPNLLDEQRLAGAVWIVGQVVLLPSLIAWLRADGKSPTSDSDTIVRKAPA